MSRFRGTSEAHKDAARRQVGSLKYELALVREALHRGDCRHALSNLVFAAERRGMYGAERTWVGGRQTRWSPSKYKGGRVRGGTALVRLQQAFLKKCVVR